MIWRATIGDISRPPNSGSRGIETGAFIQCVTGRDPQIQNLWCWDIGRIFCEVHPTARVEIPAGTVRDCVTD